MRSTLVVSGLAVVLCTASLVGCKGKEQATGDPSHGSAQQGQASAALRARGGEMGGQLVDVGPHKVELRVFDNGAGEAIVYDAQGKKLADPAKAKVKLRARAASNAKANAKAGGDGTETIELEYQPALARFTGKASGNVDLDPAPIDVEVSVGGQTATGKLEAPVLFVAPEIGGTLVALGTHSVELVADADGEVQAIVRTADGKRLNADANVDVSVKLATKAGAEQTVKLKFDPPRMRFVGRADAGVELAAGPAEIAIGAAASARLPKLALRAEAKHGGRLVVAGDYSVELVAKGDVVGAFVFDASGAAVTKADLDLSLRVGNGAFVKLSWDAPSLSYRADVDSKIDFAVTPVALSVKAGADVYVGALVPRVNVDANVAARADLDAKAKAAANANAKAKVEVKPPPIQPVKVEVNKSASAGAKAGANAGAGAGASAGAGAKAGFSLGTR